MNESYEYTADYLTGEAYNLSNGFNGATVAYLVLFVVIGLAVILLIVAMCSPRLIRWITHGKRRNRRGGKKKRPQKSSSEYGHGRVGHGNTYYDELEYHEQELYHENNVLRAKVKEHEKTISLLYEQLDSTEDSRGNEHHNVNRKQGGFDNNPFFGDIETTQRLKVSPPPAQPKKPRSVDATRLIAQIIAEYNSASDDSASSRERDDFRRNYRCEFFGLRDRERSYTTARYTPDMYKLDALDRCMLAIRLDEHNDEYLIFPQFFQVDRRERARFEDDGMHTFFDVSWSTQRPRVVKPAEITISSQSGGVIFTEENKGELT